MLKRLLDLMSNGKSGDRRPGNWYAGPNSRRPRSMSACPITQAVWPLPNVVEHREMTDQSPTWRPDEVVWPDSASSDT